MDILQAIFLGIVQGLTEFIPISSSAHLIIVPWLLGWREPGLAFDAALHLGTLLAVVAYFWTDWLALAAGFLRSLDERHIGSDPKRLMAWLILIGSIPGGVAGLLLDDFVEGIFHNPDIGQATRAMFVISGLVMALAVILWLAERLAHHNRSLESIGWRDALIIGLAQAAALLPGVSRSGATITAGLFLGLERAAAARFSFLLATPIIAGAGLKKVYDVARAGLAPGDQAAFAAGFLAAAVSGYLCIAFLLRYLQRNSTLVFVWYRIGLGVFLIVVALAR